MPIFKAIQPISNKMKESKKLLDVNSTNWGGMLWQYF